MKKLISLLVVLFVVATANTILLAQNTVDASPAVNVLVDKIFPIFPNEEFETEINAGIAAEIEKIKKSLLKSLEEKMDLEGIVETNERSRILKNFEKIIPEIVKRADFIMRDRIEIDKWIKVSLVTSISNKYSLKEVDKVNLFLNSTRLAAWLKVIEEVKKAENEEREPDMELLDIDDDIMIEIAEFFETPEGIKFMSILDEEFQALFAKQVDDWTVSLNEDLQHDLKKGELHKIFLKFSIDNDLGSP